MYRNRNMRGGNANVRPAEYYGGDSGKYYETPPAAGLSAYGQINAVSHGVTKNNVVGPNLAVYPGGSLLQTGGRCPCGKLKRRGGGSRRRRAASSSRRRAASSSRRRAASSSRRRSASSSRRRSASSSRRRR
jgi:hypothetical protein